MAWSLSRWREFCLQSAAARFIDWTLRGAGQVMFQNNPLSGLLFLLALTWGSFSGGMPHVVIGGILALVSATATGLWLRADKAALASGALGYNGVLTGLALTYFLGPGLVTLVYATVGGIVTTFVMLGPVNADKPWRVVAHTYPFILTTWIFLLATQGFHAIPAATPQVELPPIDASLPYSQQIWDFFSALLHSISQIYFKENALSALLIVAGLAAGSLAAAVFAVMGACLAVLTAHLGGIESELISSGVQGFSPVLTAIAFGTVFYQGINPRVCVLAGVATVVTVIAQSALHTLLDPLSLPTLSAPFDLVAWMFFLNRKHIDKPRPE